MRIRELHDREGHHEQQRGRHDHADEGGFLVFEVQRHRRGPLVGGEICGQATRTEFITSSFWICFTISMPFVTLPNTVCTPFRCRVAFSSSTTKTWLPRVSLPACAIESAPSSCLRGFPCVSHLIM